MKRILNILMLVCILVLGCASIPTDTPKETISSGTQIIWKTIASTDWLSSIFLMGFVCSIVGIGLGMTKLGVSCAVACVAGLFLKSALSALWFYQAAALVVLASILIVIAGIIFKNKAIKELIIGVQAIKTETPGSKPVSDIMKENQSKPTVALVNQVKAELKTKGVI